MEFFGVGISTYLMCEDLDYAADDCERMANTLRQLGLTTRDKILVDGQLNALPVRNEIYRQVRRFLAEGAEDLPKMFYFAGHGVSVGGSLHICPSDFDPEISDKTSIDVSEFVLEFGSRSPWSMFCFDCCRSALRGAKGESRGSPLSGAMKVSDNAVVMFACSKNQYALEAAALEGDVSGGIFTHFLIQALQSRLAKGGSRASIMEIFESARDQTCQLALEAAGKDQVPRIFGAHGGDFFFQARENAQG